MKKLRIVQHNSADIMQILSRYYASWNQDYNLYKITKISINVPGMH